MASVYWLDVLNQEPDGSGEELHERCPPNQSTSEVSREDASCGPAALIVHERPVTVEHDSELSPDQMGRAAHWHGFRSQIDKEFYDAVTSGLKKMAAGIADISDALDALEKRTMEMAPGTGQNEEGTGACSAVSDPAAPYSAQT